MRLLFAINSLAFLRSHRRPLVAAARARGWDVHIVAGAPVDARDEAAREDLIALGAQVHAVPVSRASSHPLHLIRTTRALRRVFVEVRPDLVHQVTPVMVVCGSIAARLARVPAVVTAISGLGFMFAGDSFGARVRSAIGRLLYSTALRHPRQVVIVQNERDLAEMRALVPDGTRFERFHGSGVDMRRFVATPLPGGVPVVLLPARMLRHKGVPEFAAAARLLRERGVPVRMVLSGAPDAGNPTSLTESELRALAGRDGVEYWGFQADMVPALAQASIVCLPSTYGEGLPLALAEAAAAGRPIITTDTPGCRDCVIDGISGRIVAPGDADAVARAIAELLADPVRLATMGSASRRLAESRFSVEEVTAGHLRIYDSLAPAPGLVPPSRD